MKKVLAIGFLIVLLILGGILLFPSKGPGARIQLGNYDLEGITKIELTNCHNGCRTDIAEETDIAAILDFVTPVIGEYSGSGKGYYEGSYALALYRGEKQVLSLAFGDSDCFYMGKGRDGYPVRYLLVNKTVGEDIIPFFAQFDQSVS
jgi:hypothetical protein